MSSQVGWHVSQDGRSYSTTLTRSEWEAERAKADEVHVVKSERSTSGSDE